MPPLDYNLIFKGGKKMIGVAIYITIKSLLWKKYKNKSLIIRLASHDFKDSSQEDKRYISGKRIMI